ncbi:MAG: methyltransferase [Pyrinomonadaceae bacterium]
MEIHAQPEEPRSTPPQGMILQMAMGAIMTQALGAAAKLGVADLLVEGERSVDELADQTGTHGPSLYRILRSLASTGIFRETATRTFSNTEMSDPLRSHVPGSMRHAVIFMAEPWHYNVWGNMLHSARTGETAWKKTYGEEVFEWLPKHPEASEVFNKAMTDMSGSVAPAIVEAYDFSGIEVLADIAGGHGLLLSQILKVNPDLRGILFDLDHVVAGAGALLQREGVADRVQTSSGDFFREVPAADGYIMKHIIHDWDDDRSIKIMQSIHRAMSGDGPMLLVEMVVPEGNEPHPSKILDLEMLTSPGGLERTEKEYSALFTAAGFRLNRVIPTRSPFMVIEALKS